MRNLAILFSLISMLLATNSCDKFRKDPILKSTYAEIADDGLRIQAIVENDKNVSASGFCYGTSSNPQALNYADVLVSIDANKMETVIPYSYFSSYTGYYVRPFVKTDQGIFYGDEVYFENLNAPLLTPPCTPSDNFIHVVGLGPSETFTSFDMPDEGSYFDYTIRAFSNSHQFRFEFNSKPKTGIYTASYGSEDPDKVHIYFYSGMVTGSVNPGTTVYVNEVESGKFEISLCNAPWKQTTNGSDFYMTTKVVTP